MQEEEEETEEKEGEEEMEEEMEKQELWMFTLEGCYRLKSLVRVTLKALLR